MNGKLTPQEAMAVQVLSVDPNWQKFKEYLMRRYLQASNECETSREDHRFHQGCAQELKMMANIETKAKNILEGV